MNYLKFFSIAIACAMCLPAFAAEFIVKGKVKHSEGRSKICLGYPGDDGNYLSDTANIVDGNFTIKGQVSVVQKATLQFISDDKAQRYIYLEFYLEPGNVLIEIDEDIREAQVSAGAEQALAVQLKGQIGGPRKELDSVFSTYRSVLAKKDSVLMKDYLAAVAKLSSAINLAELDFVKRNPESMVAFDVVKARSYIIDVERFSPFLAALGEKAKDSEEGREMSNRLEIAKKTGVGKPMIEVNLADSTGNLIKLSEVKGKYVLLEFWSSWCGPCRAENPNLKRAYAEFKDKGFEIYAVSLDSRKADWLKAIKDDDLPWIHVSDLQGLQCAAAVEYGIIAIPQNILIDNKGTIVEKNLRGDSLQITLSKLLN